jgi:uncharacterized repeat protein (TIGR01451 family)
MKIRAEMRLILWGPCLILALALGLSNTSPAGAGLVAHYEMEENGGTALVDSSASGNTAAISGSPTWVPGIHGLALNFDGTDDYALAADGTNLDITAAITLAAWVKPGKTATQYLIKKATQSGTDGYELSLATTGTAFVRFNQAFSQNSYRLDTASLYPSDGNTWVHLAATYDGSYIRIYFNGVEEGTAIAGPASITANDLALGIGAQSDGGSKFQGAMDDVRIYDEALSASDIAALAELPPTADLSITIDDGMTEADPGDPVTYTITVTNNGPGDVAGATATDTFPPEITGISWTCLASGGATCTAGGTGDINDSVDLPNGDSVTYTVQATLAAGAVGFVRNNASVALPSGTVDPNPGNNTATDGTFMAGTGDSSLVAHYAMEENSGTGLLDSSFYMNDGLLYGNPGWGSGVEGLAMEFDGAGDYALVPDNPSLDITDKITLAAWIKAGKADTQYLIKKAIIGNTDGFELALSSPSSGAGPQKVFVRFNEHSSANVYRLNSTSTYPVDGTWIHAAATYDGSTIRIYYNGREEGSAPGPSAIAVNNLDLGIGADSSGATQFQGSLDDVRVYNRALSAFEIRRLAGFCEGDYDTDGDADGADLWQIVSGFGCASGCSTDITGDDAADQSDVELFAEQFGGLCP